MERQIHGFLYEKNIIDMYNLHKSDNYTSKFDAFEGNIPVSIKCIKKKGSIDFGDMIRQYNIESDFILYIGFWENTKDNIVEEHRIFFDKNSWRNLFGEYDLILKMDNFVKNEITNDKIDDSKWKKEIAKFKLEYGKSNIIQPRFKRDHKSQRRLQCGISYTNFINYIKQI